MGKPDDQMLNGGARTYLAHAVKAATHPVRREILKSLKKGPQSTVDLEGELKEVVKPYRSVGQIDSKDSVCDRNSLDRHFRFDMEGGERP